MQACLRNEASLDRPPVALWRHFPVDDQSPGSLAEATLDFQDHYDFDLVKVTPASSFCIKDWGAEDTWEGNTEGTRRYTKRVIQEPRDWERLEVLDPKKASHLSAQLKCLKMIRKDLEPETPLLQTIFSPLTTARKLAGERIFTDLRTNADLFKHGMEVITQTTIKFALGENVKQSNWGDKNVVRYPQTRMGVETIMKDALQAAKEYGADWDKYNALSASGKAKVIRCGQRSACRLNSRSVRSRRPSPQYPDWPLTGGAKNCQP